MEIEIANYLNRVVDGRLSYEGKMRISSMLSIVSEIESIADSCNNLARTMVRQHEAKVTFNQIVSANIDTMFKYTSEALENMILLLRDIDNADEKHIIFPTTKSVKSTTTAMPSVRRMWTTSTTRSTRMRKASTIWTSSARASVCATTSST